MLLNKHQIPIFSFVGYSGSGKTTLLTKVIQAFKEKGYRVATIKHDAHRFNIDHEGKDTWKYAQAGSDMVIINSNEKLAMVERLETPRSFEEVISHVKDVDIILVEGYKHEAPSKILVARRQEDLALLKALKDVVAIATPFSDIEMEGIQVFHLDDVQGVVKFIQSKILGENENGAGE